MMIFGGIHVKVNTEVLNRKADTVLTEIQSMVNCFDQIETIVNRSKSYWMGEAGNEHRKMFADQKEDIDIMVRRLKEHTVDLRTIAGRYEAVEREASEIGDSLTGDVIE